MTTTLSRIHVVSEGVLASYIHDISSRATQWRALADAPRPVARAAAEEETPCTPG
jgi:hypothetical protein